MADPYIKMEMVITGSEKAMGALRGMKDRASNLKGLAPEMHSYLIGTVLDTFETEGSNIGESWEGYTGSELAYGVIKRVLLGADIGRRLLRWEPGNERLFPSLVGRAHSDHVWKITDSTFEFGTRVPYAANHQYGRGRGPWWAGFPKIKRRTFLKITRKMSDDITRAIRNFMGLGTMPAGPGGNFR